MALKYICNQSSSQDSRMVKRRRYGNRVFIIKLSIIAVLVYSSYCVLLTISNQYDHLGSSLKNIKISSLLRKQPKKIPEECPLLRYNNSIPLTEEGCHRMTPIPGSCQLADQLFFSAPKETCYHQLKTDICKITESGDDLIIKCSEKICEDKKVSLGLINDDTGDLQWQDFPSTEKLETHMKNFLAGKRDHYGFCFIKCSINIDEIPEETADEVINSNNGMEEYIMVDNVAQQLLVIPPFMNKNQDPKPHININILLLDSVSNSHFLRSMPKTLRALRQVKDATVFNFELFQALKARTFENLETLFSGKLYDVEKPFGVHDMPPFPLDFRQRLSGFKKQGYEIMYTEDLCWMWEWGIVKNLLAFMPGYDIEKRWKTFLASLYKAGIDRIDMTLSSCEILDVNQHHDPFHGPPAICYNGHYQHQYILDYLSKRQKSLETNDQLFFHNTILNVGHDDYGRRIQTLDEDLPAYVEIVSKLNDTLTIIFADHGNAYGTYVQKSNEAIVELFHPVLFMIVPPGVANALGKTRMNALRTNQQRLVSILDLHYALRFISDRKLGVLDEKHKQYQMKADGIFSEISINRTCDDIPRIQPNLCICDGYESAAKNTERFAILAEFGLGTINNVIQNQYRNANPGTLRGFGSCQRLIPHHFGNVKQRKNKNGDQEVKLDLFVPTPDNASVEIIMVIVAVSTKDIKFIAFERMSPYSPFEVCSDKDVNIKLCVCSVSKPHQQENKMKVAKYPPVFGSKTVTKSIHNNCLFIFERQNHKGVVLEASNQCANKKYSIELKIVTKNLLLSSTSPIQADLWPGMMSFLVAMVKNDKSKKWDYKYSVKYGLLDVNR